MIIDFHTHVLPDQFRKDRSRALRADATYRALFSSPRARSAPAEDLLAAMDATGVDRAVILGYGWCDIGVARTVNDYLLASAAASKGRLLPFCSVNPGWGDAAVGEIERCAAAGAVGIGELHPDTQEFDVADEHAVAQVMNAAEALGFAVTVHGSEPVGHSYPGKGTVTPDRLLRLALLFPRNRFVFAHWGGGLPFYGLMPRVAPAMRRVWFDSAATAFLYLPAVFEAATTAAGADRVLFGSDFPLIKLERALADFRSASLPPPTASAVLGGNAVALLEGTSGP